MIHAIRHRLALIALAALAGLVLAASPAAATDDPAPRPAPHGEAPFSGPHLPSGAQAPATAPAKKRAAKKSKRVRVHVRYRKHRKVRVSLTGPGLRGVKRVEVLVNGRRIARDSARPFRLKIKRSKLSGSQQLQVRLVGADGTVRTINRRLRSGKRGATAHRSAFESIATSISLNALLSRYGVV